MPPLLPGNFLVSMLGWENAGQWKSNPSHKNADSVIKTEKYKQYAWGGGDSWGLECPPSAVTGWGECWLICEASCSKQIPVWLFEQASCASQSPCHMPAIIHNFTMKTNTANEIKSYWLIVAFDIPMKASKCQQETNQTAQNKHANGRYVATCVQAGIFIVPLTYSSSLFSSPSLYALLIRVVEPWFSISHGPNLRSDRSMFISQFHFATPSQYL